MDEPDLTGLPAASPDVRPGPRVPTGRRVVRRPVEGRQVALWFAALTAGLTWGIALRQAEAIVPGAPPPVETGGTLSAARFDGQSYSVDATCHWDRGMKQVVRLTARLPDEIGSLSGQTLVIDFAGGHVSTSGSGQSATLSSGPGALDAPRGAVRPPDDSSGRLVLDGRHGGTVTGSLGWTCFPAAPNFGHSPPATGRAAPRPSVSSW